MQIVSMTISMKYQILFSGDNLREISNPIFWER